MFLESMSSPLNLVLPLNGVLWLKQTAKSVMPASGVTH
ncbi:hypothetical protein CQP30_15790 [Yersinia pestis]|uniref:Uncharacterized protein n=1 Tax=Yersinia pestis TaxID=632 RepID=A0A384KN03_YERPE|nr:hypothetical protein BAY22_17640 [Yersinia pestis]AYW86475.1 hypothetical protein EGX87_04125 [Yersinia pseudotuberculosis]EDM39409.1 hypothetical protein YPE_3660 [Yersinia pestis CA88-4125]EDR41346.1 conserved hypothetical protein [Yersinia pestis biovar Antiqua str. E1979001]EDR48896.1 conserved hypothetical protein [Yersinia pestis biovar Antiqua str. B42003004]EDR64036.1 conserved hypothetical protein [Yersinia pestis biovar Mediaevalis str. K1973002]EIQ84186.1 hypothetical protein YP